MPCVPADACAMDCPEALAMDRPASARAPLLITPETEARAPEVDGANA